MIVHAEEKENSILLTSIVEKRRLYQRQQGIYEEPHDLSPSNSPFLPRYHIDTLIVWTESDSRDLALSFQDPTGCEEIW